VFNGRGNRWLRQLTMGGLTGIKEQTWQGVRHGRGEAPHRIGGNADGAVRMPQRTRRQK
jgi:hypothetical protein